VGPARRLKWRLLAAAACVTLAACSTAPATSQGPGATGSGVSNAPSEIANLPDLGLTNVKTETANARGATIGSSGGTIEAAATDGTTYTLDIPAHALDQATKVSLYPVSSVAGLPAGATLASGIQFGPDGTRLLVPATLTVALPAAVDASKLSGLGWSGDAKGIGAIPVGIHGKTATLRVYHFSGAGLGQLPLVPIGTCFTASDMGSLIGHDIDLAINHDASALQAFTSDLKVCYDNYVSQLMAVASKESTNDNLDDAEAAVDAYQFWLDGISYWAASVFPNFSVSPELSDSKPLAVKLLRNWFESFNFECIAAADQPSVAIVEATLALDTPHEKAAEWGLDSKANKLDYGSLLDELCVQIVIDGSRNFSGSRPGEQGTVTVPVGYSIDGQAVQHDRAIDVELTLTGQTSTFADDDAPADGKFTAPLAWPDGVDPLKIDVLASFDFDGNLSEIARFDRITKTQHSKIVFSARASASSPTTSIYVMEDTGQSVVRLTNGPSNDLDPRWSPDGATIVFERNRSIYTMAADGSDVQQLTSGTLDEAPAWSPDGSKIAFERRQIGSALPGPGESFIDLMSADGSNIVETGVITAEGQPLSWSPDGSRIAYTQQLVNGSDIRLAIGVMGADGHGASTIAGSPTSGKLQGGTPAWSPDGSRIAFVCFGFGIPEALCMVSASGGGASQAVKSPCGSPTWSPDGSKIACLGDDQTIRVIDLSTGSVASLGAGGASFAGQPDWGQ
jgi:WD40 repeat protein